MRLVERLSPNHDARPEDAAIDMLVLHYTGMKTGEEALARLCDPEARVSAHYTVDRDGCVYAHVPEELRAWHAGVSYWAGERNINGCSIGIEIVNPGHEFGYEPFPKVQIAAVIDLCDDIMARHRIPAMRVLGHSDVAPARKEDPGELFPWAHVAEFGIGVWPFAAPPSARGARASANGDATTRADSFIRNLGAYGYGTPPEVEVSLEKLIMAFQRHWRPERVDGVIDDETEYRLRILVAALS